LIVIDFSLFLVTIIIINKLLPLVTEPLRGPGVWHLGCQNLKKNFHIFPVF
jgi:hypothetical protein